MIPVGNWATTIFMSKCELSNTSTERFIKRYLPLHVCVLYRIGFAKRAILHSSPPHFASARQVSEREIHSGGSTSRRNGKSCGE